jgi:hypothetical protein
MVDLTLHLIGTRVFPATLAQRPPIPVPRQRRAIAPAFVTGLMLIPRSITAAAESFAMVQQNARAFLTLLH